MTSKINNEINLIKSVVTGNFRIFSIEKESIIPTWKLIVFLSSTFTDTKNERNCLIDKILPKLSIEATSNEIQVIFIDMRWGIRDENTLDHKTWFECQRY